MSEADESKNPHAILSRQGEGQAGSGAGSRTLLSPAKHSYNDFVAVRSRMSFPHACLAPVRNPETSAWTGEKIGTAAGAALNEVKGLGAAVVPSLRSGRQEPLRAAASRENDKPGIVQDQNRHYDM